jgi:hypothetical protein
MAQVECNGRISEQDDELPSHVRGGNSLASQVTAKGRPCTVQIHHAMEAYWESGGIAPLIL